MRRFLLIVLAVLLCASARSAGHPGELPCGTRPVRGNARLADGDGGIYLPSAGVLRILVVFASFPDDTTAHAYWPAHQAPLFMNSFIDGDTVTHSTIAFNLTNYFRQMSLGKFHVIGDAVWVESKHSQEEYRNSGSYGAANMALLPESVDPVVDFSRYDHWTRTNDYTHVNAPDGIVDMIVVVWRTTMWGYLGEASLGYKPAILADGKRIEMGYPGYYPQPIGSGVTCEYPYGDTPVHAMRTMVHEMSHWLLGMFHPYNGSSLGGKFQYWGMLCNGERASGCANTYDRERLGWTVPVVVQPGQTIRLGDFITSGAAAKFHPPSGEPDEYFYLENHQGISVFDDVTAEPGDRGVWVLHQQGPYVEMDNIRILPSDGMWQWNAPAFNTACYGVPVPLFTRGAPDILNGLSHRDQIPTPSSIVNWMLAFKDEAGTITCGPQFAGSGFRGAFDTSGSRIFASSANPAPLTWVGTPAGFSFEIAGDSNGTMTLMLPADPLTLSPARRYLGASPAGHAAGEHALAWGAQWATAPPVEPDVVTSELQRVIGPGGTWTTVYAGSALSWTDSSMAYDSTGPVIVRFRVRVNDTQGHSSVWSMEHVTRASSSTFVDSPLPGNAALLTNYPNPFNPSTTVMFSLPNGQWTRVEVVDLVGRQVKELSAGFAGAGSHTIRWDGRNGQGNAVAGGVYFCRLVTEGHVLTRAMLLLK